MKNAYELSMTVTTENRKLSLKTGFNCGNRSANLWTEMWLDWWIQCDADLFSVCDKIVENILRFSLFYSQSNIRHIFYSFKLLSMLEATVNIGMLTHLLHASK